jgi:hypothetical protein
VNGPETNLQLFGDLKLLLFSLLTQNLNGPESIVSQNTLISISFTLCEAIFVDNFHLLQEGALAGITGTCHKKTRGCQFPAPECTATTQIAKFHVKEW